VSKHVILDAEANTNWRLPAETDLKQLEKEIGRSMTDGTYLTVPVEMQDDPRKRATLILSGRALPFVVLAELPDEGPDGRRRWREESE
jgi:hypothetical protein